MNAPEPLIKSHKVAAKVESALNKFFTLSLDLFCTTGEDGYFQQLNPAWEKVLGWTESELLHTPWMERVHPDDVEDTLEKEKWCSQENLVEYENRYRHKDGSYRWFSWRVSRAEDGCCYRVAKDISDAKQAEEALCTRLEFESLITTLSTEFIRLSSEEIDGGINHALRAIGEFAGCDRSYVVLFSDSATGVRTGATDRIQANLAYAWHTKAVEPLSSQWQKFPIEPASWWMEKLKRFEVIQISTLAALPPESYNTKVTLQSAGIQSIVAVPIVEGKSLIGYTGLVAISQEKTWSDDILALLRVASNIFASALSRKQAESKLRESERRFRAVFNQTFQLSSILALDGTVLDDNQTALDFCQLQPSESVGGRFWDLQCWTISPETQEQLKQAIAQAAAGNIVRYEADILAPDNTVVTIDFSLKPLKDEHGKVELLIAEGRDLMERKQTEEALRASEAKFRSLSACSPVGIFLADVEGRCTYTNPRLQAILGLTSEGILGQGWAQAVHPDDRAGVFAEWSQCALQGQECSQEYRFQTPTGVVRWVQVRTSPMHSERGELLGHVGTVEDISDRKQAEAALQQALSELETKVEERTADLKQINEQLQAEIAERQRTEAALRQSEAQFRRIFDQAPLGMGLTSLDGHFFRVNQAWLDMLGYTESELKNLTCEDVTHPEDWQQTIPYLQQIKQGEIDSFKREQRFLKKNQEILWGNLTSMVLRDRAGEILCGLGMVEDITERKQAEVALRQSEEQFRRVFDEAPIGMSLAGMDDQYIRVNRAFFEMLGYTQSELMALTFLDITHPEDLELEMPYMEQLVQGEIDSFEIEKRYLTKNREIIWVNLTLIALRNPAGDVLYTLAMIEDVTERKKAEEALRQSEARYRAIIEDQTELICRYKPDGTLTFVNDAYCRYFNKPHSELIGHNFMPVIPKEDLEAITKSFGSLCAEHPIITYEHRVILPSGEIRWQQWTDRALFDGSDQLLELQAVGRDITKLKQAEAEILRALERERELSELRSGFVSLVSHEFRTPLTTIQSSAELLDRYSHKLSDERKQNHLKRIQTAVQRMTQLLEDVLTIGKAEAGKLKFEPSSIDLVAFCHDMVETLQLNVQQQHKLNFVAHGDCTEAQMDEKLLSHILTNLLSNALKYSPQGGTVQFDLICDRSQAIFRIQDSGIGIPSEDLEQLFESFRRASNVGTIPGTGLGLAIVKKCVDLHGGEITVESEVGVGTTFSVMLPLKSQADVMESSEER